MHPRRCAQTAYCTRPRRVHRREIASAALPAQRLHCPSGVHNVQAFQENVWLPVGPKILCQPPVDALVWATCTHSCVGTGTARGGGYSSRVAAVRQWVWFVRCGLWFSGCVSRYFACCPAALAACVLGVFVLTTVVCVAAERSTASLSRRALLTHVYWPGRGCVVLRYRHCCG